MRAWVGCCILLLLVGCGGTGNSVTKLTDSTPRGQQPQVTIDELAQQLQAEFVRLGIDPEKVPATAPTGTENQIFDMAVRLVDPDDDGPLPPEGMELTWTEQMVGDYDQNGEVNLGDLTPLGLNFGALVDYGPPEPPGEPAWWPTGDPAADGAENWRLARVDGDHNGELNVGDITPIAQHWNQRIHGFCIYHRTGETDFEMVVSEPGDDFTVARAEAIIGGAPAVGKPVLCSYFIALTDPGNHSFQLACYDSEDGAEGQMSTACSITVNQAPVADLTADPATGTAPLEVAFDASGSSDDSGIVLYEWDFNGDGEFDDSTTTPYTELTYLVGGEFDATVRVTDEQGLTDTASVKISVEGFEPGLVIMPDPADPDWDNVTGTGVQGDPYVLAEEGGNLDVEFSLVAYDVDYDSMVLLDPATLTWYIDPPFLLTWTGPGSFKPTIFTSNYIIATDITMRTSNPLYVVVHSMPE